MKQWVTLQGEALREFHAHKGHRRTGEHAFKARIAHWGYCTRCGLVLLKNERTRRAAKADCVWYED